MKGTGSYVNREDYDRLKEAGAMLKFQNDNLHSQVENANSKIFEYRNKWIQAGLTVAELRAEVENLRKHAADDLDNIRLVMAQRDQLRAEVERFQKELAEAAKLMNGGYYYKVRDLLAAHDALKGTK